MTSTAINAQGATLKIGTGSSGAKTITGITAALPGVFTSAAHGLSAGDVVALAAIVGMTQLNGLTGVVRDVTTNTFTLQGTGVRDTSAYTAYSSGGTATPVAFTAVANLHNVNVSGAAAQKVDITNLISTGKEYLQGLPDFGTITLDIDYDYADAGQAAMIAAQATQATKAWKLTLPDTRTLTFNAYVAKYDLGVAVDSAVKRPFELQITGAPVWA